MKNGETLEDLQTEFHRLEGSIIKMDGLPKLSELKHDMDQYEKQKVLYTEEMKDYEGKISFLQQDQEKINKHINELLRNIINISEKDINSSIDLEELETLNNKYENMEIDIESVKEELDIIHYNLNNFNIDIDNIPIDLPLNYDNVQNKNIVEELNNKLYSNNQKLERNRELIKKFNIKPIKIFTISDNYEKREDIFNKNMIELKTKIKKLYQLPEKNIDSVEDEITRLNEKSINLTDLQNQIDFIKKINIEEEGLVYVSTSRIKNIITLLENVKKNIGNESENKKLKELLKFREQFYENNEIEENNKIIEKEIKDMYYCYYFENISDLENINSDLNIELEKLNQYQYSYQYKQHEKALKLKEIIKYKNMLGQLDEYNIFLQQKRKNEEFTNESKKCEYELEELKDKMVEFQNHLKYLKNKIDETETNLNNIKIHDSNSKTLKKIKLLEIKIKNQKIINKYNELFEILKYENKYENNLVLQEKIKRCDTMVTQLLNDMKLTMDSYMETKTLIISLEKDISQKTDSLKELQSVKEKEEDLNSQLTELTDDLELHSEYMKLVNKNNIPMKLIHKKNSYIQKHINEFLEKLTKYTISIDIGDKNSISFNAHKNGLILDVNQLSGYETFILNIALKSALNKYSFISKSTLFILDEGLDVVDKDNFKKLDTLMKLLMKDYKHILLISHMPKVKDLQHNEINIQNDGRSSYIV